MLKTRTAYLCLICLAATACTSLAPAPTPSELPEAAEEAVESQPAVEPVTETAPAIEIETVTLPSEGSPLVSLRLLFRAGSIYDPPGKEGLAALTGLLLGQGGTEKRSYNELIDALYPMAASIDVTTDREVTVFSGTIHREKLDEFTELFAEALLQPAFTEEDFSRHKQQLESTLKNTLRAANDELLGLEAMQQVLFDGHPYGHAPTGTVQGLAAITLDDVQAFYASRYTASSLMLGVAGGYPEGYLDALQEILATLPPGDGSEIELPAPAAVEGRDFVLIEKPTASVGIHFGFPLPLTRADADYYPLMVANSYLGEHRTFHGRLMRQLRGKRGLNYGDYSYIEHWHQPPFTMSPTPNVPRRQAFFSVWLRPVRPETAHFALRNALYEVDRLIEHGLDEEEFELTRSFLVNYSKLWAQTLSNRLGFLMDSAFYRMEYYIDEIEERLAELTVEDVNAAVRKYLQSENFKAVFVTDNAGGVQDYLTAETPSPMEYNTPPDEDVLEVDQAIVELQVLPDEFTIVPVEEMFER